MKKLILNIWMIGMMASAQNAFAFTTVKYECGTNPTYTAVDYGPGADPNKPQMGITDLIQYVGDKANFLIHIESNFASPITISGDKFNFVFGKINLPCKQISNEAGEG